MIRVEHLYKNYGDSVKVLFDVNFTFEDGKTYAIIGSSGGGEETIQADLSEYAGGTDQRGYILQ